MSTISTVLSVSYGEHPRQRLDVFVPTGASGALLLCIPGGWWSDGRHESLRLWCLALAERGLACASLGHRPLGDGAKTGSDILDDLVAASERAADEAAVCGHDGGVVPLGSGSGSLSALVLAARLVQRGKPAVRGVIACGVTPGFEPNDGIPAAHRSACDRFAGNNHRELSPLHLDPAAFPPVLLLHGDADRELTLEQARRLHTRLTGAGEVCRLDLIPGAGHQFIEDPLSRPAQEAIQHIVGFSVSQAKPPESLDLFAGRRA
jgi:acetyl esterase/lipase